MDQLFALGSIFTGMKILGLAPDEISTALARIADIPTRHLMRLVTLVGQNPGLAHAASTCVGLILPGSYRTRCRRVR